MKKLILVLVAFLPLTIFAQDFKAEIEKHREEYKADFLKNSNSPLKKEDFAYLRFHTPNEKFKVLCEFVPTKRRNATREKPLKIPTSSGQTATYTKFGELQFEIDGKLVILDDSFKLYESGTGLNTQFLDFFIHVFNIFWFSSSGL